MKNYNITVNFISKKIFPEVIELVKNDYNSTILNFKFDVSADRYLFKLKFPDETEWIQQITDNKLILEKGVLAQKGIYQYEIAAYGLEDRLTAIAIGKLNIRNELISTDEIISVDDRIPILDKLINEVDTLNLDVDKIDNVAKVTLISKDGVRKEVEILDGTAGAKGEDAKINGVNTLEIVEGENITLNQNGSTLTINAKDTVYDDKNLRNLVNQINEDLGKTDTNVQNLQNDIDSLDDTKADKSEIPDVSEFIKKTVDNLVNYYKKAETYSQQEINNLIGAIKTVSMKVLPERPTTGEANIIYLIPSPKQETNNVYDEWIYVDNKWEKIGSTQADLTNYYTKEEVNTLLFDYITSNDLEEILEGYAKTTDIPKNISELYNDKAYISEEDIEDDYAKKTYVDDKIGYINEQLATLTTMPDEEGE